MPYNTFQPNYQYQTYPQYPQVFPQQQYQQTPYMPQTQQQNQQTNNLPQQVNQAPISPKFDVVQGELAANMYPVENGQQIILIDMDNPFVYKKKRGLDGKIEPMEVFELVQRENNPAQQQKIDLDGYVKEDEIADIVARAVKEEVEKKLSEITLKPSTRKTTKGDD